MLVINPADRLTANQLLNESCMKNVGKETGSTGSDHFLSTNESSNIISQHNFKAGKGTIKKGSLVDGWRNFEQNVVMNNFAA